MSEAASISYDDFVDHVLAPWRVESAADTTTQTPFAAAAKAAFSAIVDFESQPGTILVTSLYSDDVRATQHLLKAFFEDQPKLAPLLDRVTPDGVELRGGTRIVVTSSTARRPLNLLRHFKLARRDDECMEDIDHRNLARTILHVAHSDWCNGRGDFISQLEEAMGLEPGSFAADFQRAKEDLEAHWAEWEATAIDLPKPKEQRPIQDIKIDGRDYFSEEWEERTCRQREMGALYGHAPNVIRFRPKDAR